MIDGSTGLIIGRDIGEGKADKACPEDQKRTDCFRDLAQFKRVYKVKLTDGSAGGALRKIAYIDLMAVADPNKPARKSLSNGVLTFFLLHHRKRRCEGRQAHHCWQRQQPVVFQQPRADPGRRQRSDSAGSC